MCGPQASSLAHPPMLRPPPPVTLAVCSLLTTSSWLWWASREGGDAYLISCCEWCLRRTNQVHGDCVQGCCAGGCSAVSCGLIMQRSPVAAIRLCLICKRCQLTEVWVGCSYLWFSTAFALLSSSRPLWLSPCNTPQLGSSHESEAWPMEARAASRSHQHQRGRLMGPREDRPCTHACVWPPWSSLCQHSAPWET